MHSNEAHGSSINGTIEPALPLRSTILVVEEDNGTRRCLTRNLRRFGYRLLVAADVEDVLEWVSGDVYIHADLLLIDLIGKLPEEALIIGRDLRVRAQYHSQTPLIVMPETVAENLEGTDANVCANDWICYYEDSDQLQRLLVRLLHNPNNVPLDGALVRAAADKSALDGRGKNKA